MSRQGGGRRNNGVITTDDNRGTFCGMCHKPRPVNDVLAKNSRFKNGKLLFRCSLVLTRLEVRLTSKQEDYIKSGFKSFEQWSFPRILNVCIIRGECPCRCVHCPVGTTEPVERSRRFSRACMTVDLFKRIADETALYPHSSIRVHGVGEPILWDGLVDALRYAHSKGVLIWLFTSLVTNNKELIEEISRNCNIIEVSINSSDPSDYLDTKGIDAFGKVKENLEFIRAFALREGTGSRIVASRVESNNMQRDQDFMRFWKGSGLVDDAFVRSYHSYNSLMPGRADKEAGRIVRCLVHWNRFNIDCDGTAVVCFNELFKETFPDSVILGNLNDQTISGVWHSDKLDSIRAAYIEGDLSKLPFSRDLPCLGCTSCQEEGGDRKTSEFQILNYRGTQGG